MVDRIEWPGGVSQTLPVALTIALAATCLLAASSAQADTRDVPDVADDQGRTWLVGAGELDATSGVLPAAMAGELAANGGAVLVSGRAASGCTLELELGGETVTMALDAGSAVHHAELTGTPGSAASWRVDAPGCTAELEGIVVFAGDAAAYVGDNPTEYWLSVRASDTDLHQ